VAVSFTSVAGENLDRRRAGDSARDACGRFLPVTCHLTCPVTDYASKTSSTTRFESERFTDFPAVVETLKSAGSMRRS